MTREIIDRPRFANIHCLATLPLRWSGETSRGRRVAKLNNGTTDIWKAPTLQQQRLLKRGKVDFTVLSAIVYLAHHSGPNMAAATTTTTSP